MLLTSSQLLYSIRTKPDYPEQRRKQDVGSNPGKQRDCVKRYPPHWVRKDCRRRARSAAPQRTHHAEQIAWLNRRVKVGFGVALCMQHFDALPLPSRDQSV